MFACVCSVYAIATYTDAQQSQTDGSGLLSMNVLCVPSTETSIATLPSKGLGKEVTEKGWFGGGKASDPDTIWSKVGL